MGKRGPRPDSRAIQIAKGTERKRPRPLEPSEAEGEMVKPKWLGPIASEYWDRIMRILVARKTVSPAYVDFLSAYCAAWQDYFDAQATIDEEGEFVHSEKGGVYQHPAVGKKRKAVADIGKFGREFGFSPTSIRDVQESKPTQGNKGKKRFFAS